MNSLAMIMNRPPTPTRRRFLLNTGILAAGWELSCADAALTQELAPTPLCHDGDEPTIRETEGPFLSQDRRSAATCASRAREVVGLNFLALCFRGSAARFAERRSISGMPMRRANTTTSVSDIVAMSSPGLTALSTLAQSFRRSTLVARGITTSRFKRRAAAY